MIKLAEILELPPSCGLNSLPESQPKTEIIFPHRYMNPLYDYQFSLALKIKSMLTGNSPYKRGLFAVILLFVIPNFSTISKCPFAMNPHLGQV